MSENGTAIPRVYAAINQAQAAIAKEGIAKDRKNQQQGYNFRGIDDVYNALAPILAEARLCILPRVISREMTERQSQKGGTLFCVVVDMEFDFVSAEDGSKHTVRVIGEAMDSADKASNKAMSAGFKYACMQAFCIPTEGDNDPDATTHHVKPAAAPKPAPDTPASANVVSVDTKKKGPSLEASIARVMKGGADTLASAKGMAEALFQGEALQAFRKAIAQREQELKKEQETQELKTADVPQ